MESEDNNQLFHKEKMYRSWLLEETSRQNNHDCFDIPAAKEGTDRFDFEDKLMKAAMHGCTECLEKVIKAGADVNKTGEYKVTALMWASRYGHPDCVNLLLAAGADLYMTDTFGNSALSHALNISNRILWKTGQEHNCLDILLKAIGSNVNMSPAGTETPLMCVTVLGENAWINSLIEAGADVNRTDMFGGTALMRAIAGKNDDCTQTLLKAGADVNVVEKGQWTALKYAASVLNKDCITWLLDAGAEMKDDVNCTHINAVVEDGLSYPCKADEFLRTYRCIQQLLKAGGYINQSRGKNALEAYISRFEITRGPVQKLLLAAGNIIDEKAKVEIIKDYLNQEDQDKFSLEHLSREAVRKQMITAHPHDNLFQAVPELGIPSTLEPYLVYDVSLNDNDYKDVDLFVMWAVMTKCSDSSIIKKYFDEHIKNG